MSDAPVTVVTGANSGIGRATAIHLAQQGHRVFGTVRATSRMDTFHKLAEQAGVDIDARRARRRRGRVGGPRLRGDPVATAGRVDVLVNNAGVGGNAVAEEATPELYLDVMNVNLCGAVRCLKHVLPGMRERRSGTIVNITSITGKVAAIAQSPYVASKYAFEGLSEGLAQELAPFGIRVVIIEPGVTKSAIFAKSVDAPNSTGAYDAPYRRMFQFYAGGIAEATDPVEVAQVIHHAVTTDEPQLRYAMSWGGQEMIDGRAAMADADWVDARRHRGRRRVLRPLPGALRRRHRPGVIHSSTSTECRAVWPAPGTRTRMGSAADDVAQGDAEGAVELAVAGPQRVG